MLAHNKMSKRQNKKNEKAQLSREKRARAEWRVSE